MAVQLPTFQELFGGLPEAVAYYKSLFLVGSLTDVQIEVSIHQAFLKTEPVFGEFRNYTVGEDTVRNEHIKRAVCFEANSIFKANGDPDDLSNGSINTSMEAAGFVTSEKFEDVSTTYAEKKGSTSIGLGDSSIAEVLGLLSRDAAILLSRYIRKTYGMGSPCTTAVV